MCCEGANLLALGSNRPCHSTIATQTSCVRAAAVVSGLPPRAPRWRLTHSTAPPPPVGLHTVRVADADRYEVSVATSVSPVCARACLPLNTDVSRSRMRVHRCRDSLAARSRSVSSTCSTSPPVELLWRYATSASQSATRTHSQSVSCGTSPRTAQVAATPLGRLAAATAPLVPASTASSWLATTHKRTSAEPTMPATRGVACWCGRECSGEGTQALGEKPRTTSKTQRTWWCRLSWRRLMLFLRTRARSMLWCASTGKRFSGQLYLFSHPAGGRQTRVAT